MIKQIQIGLTFWYQLTRVVPNKGPLNGLVLLLYMTENNETRNNRVCILVKTVKISLHQSLY